MRKGKMMDELSRWYENMTYQEAKDILREKMYNLKMNFIAAGYYLKYIRDHEQFREDGYESIWEFAEDNYGIKKSTASRWMAMNDKFSQDGNSPILAEEFRSFEKSQLQEMLYLDDKQMETVTPDMTVKEIREVRKPETLSAYGTKKRVFPEDSLLKTEGCEGGHDCFSCAQECAVRGEYRYCREATVGNPFPCEMVDSISSLRAKVGGKCLFVNHTLGKHDVRGDAVPCCKECKAPCQFECPASLKERAEKAETVATSQQEEQESVLDMNPPEEPSEHEVVTEESVEVMDVAEVEPAEELYEETSDRSDKDLLKEDLDKAKNNLDLMLSCYSEKDIRVRKQKLLVGALAGMLCDLDVVDVPEPEQPELPIFRNNDQRKAWLRDYKAWGLWYEDKNIGARYYKYEFENGARLIAETYIHSGDKYLPEHESSFLHLVGGPEPVRKNGISKWVRHEEYDRFPSNETELVEFLKYVQKEGK